MSKRLPLLLFILTSCSIIGGLWLVKTKKELSTNDLLSIRALPKGFSTHGIDVSRYQKEIDWSKIVELDTLHFVYCKVSEGISLKDKYWNINQSKLIELKINFGGYHFMTKDNGKLQAEHFLATYNNNKHILPPVLDIEFHPDNLSEYIQRIKDFSDEVKLKTGVNPIIYTSYSLYRDFLNEAFPQERFWIAMYSNRQHRLTNDNIIMWQYSDKGKIPGINGYVDLNFSKDSIIQ